jgi:hypothetical protein
MTTGVRGKRVPVSLSAPKITRVLPSSFSNKSSNRDRESWHGLTSRVSVSERVDRRPEYFVHRRRCALIRLHARQTESGPFFVHADAWLLK